MRSLYPRAISMSFRSERWRFSTKAMTCIWRSETLSLIIAGMVARPRAAVAVRRRSPEMSSYPPLVEARTMTGSSTPCRAIDFLRSSSSSGLMLWRGWNGLCLISPSAMLARRFFGPLPAAGCCCASAGSSSAEESSARRPRCNAFRGSLLSMFNKLLRHPHVALRANGDNVIQNDRLSRAGGLAEFDIPLDDRIEDLVAKIVLHVASHLL